MGVGIALIDLLQTIPKGAQNLLLENFVINAKHRLRQGIVKGSTFDLSTTVYLYNHPP